MKGENMTKLKSSRSARASGDQAALGRLFVLEASGNRVFSVNPDGSDRKVIVSECRLPDGIAVDVEAGHIYWTNMGVPNLNDGSIERADLDGRNRTTIVPQGGTFTPKQLQLEEKSGKLYWCDREGMRLMRANLDGSDIETLVDTSQGDPRPGRMPRSCAWAWLSMPMAARSTGRKKAETTRATGASSAPISTFRLVRRPRIARISNCCTTGCPSRSTWRSIRPTACCTGRTAAIRLAATPSTAPPWTRHPGKRQAPEILFTHLMEGIGMALDLKGGRMFITDLAGSVYSASLDGSEKRTLLCAQGNLTGIAYVEIPQQEK